MATAVAAIFDIGKTNKKVFLFDEEYRMVYEESVQLKEIADEDDFPCEDVHALSQWVKETYQSLLKNSEFQIKAINFSAHGASFVNIDAKGNPVTPLYNYLKPYPDDLKKKFYRTYGGEKDFARITASPVLGHLNSGMQLYWLRHEKPEVFEQIKYSLHLPEYLSYLLSGKCVSGITSIGCHTNLWDFTKNDYHPWVKIEGIRTKLAPIVSSELVTTAQPGSPPAGIGLHDSSAALIPYLSAFTEPFVLISTGTWCISLNPFNHEPLTPEELKSDCLCYLSYQGKPVKASRLFAGYEHEQFTKKLSAHFQTNEDHYKGITPSSTKIDFSKPFTGDLTTYTNYEEAYVAFMYNLVKQQVTSTSLVIKNSSVKRIFVDGGFSKNVVFMKFLTNAFPFHEVYAATMAQASAVGAAMAIHAQWNTKPTRRNVIELKRFS